MALSNVNTARLRLSRWDPQRHTPALAAINASREAVMFLNDGVPYTAAQTAAQSARFGAHWDEHGFGLWAAARREGGELIGFTGLSHPLWFPALAEEVEIGWRLHPAFWGHGYATEAGHAAIAAAKTELGLRRLIAVIDPANAPSLAVAGRLGFALEHTAAHPQRPALVEIHALTP